MHVTKPLRFLLLNSTTAALALLAACGDNQHLPAPDVVPDDAPVAPDAISSVCDCPAAEPPLAGRVVEHHEIVNVPSMMNGTITKACPQGQMAISGGCKLETPFYTPGTNVILREAGLVYQQGWRCTVYNGETTMLSYEIFVLCFIPAP